MKGVIKKDIKPIAKRPTQLLRMLRSIGLDYRKVKAELPRDADKAVVCSTSACLRHIKYVGIMCRKRGETVRNRSASPIKRNLEERLESQIRAPKTGGGQFMLSPGFVAVTRLIRSGRPPGA